MGIRKRILCDWLQHHRWDGTAEIRDGYKKVYCRRCGIWKYEPV